jgi:hypothetical protein
MVVQKYQKNKDWQEKKMIELQKWRPFIFVTSSKIYLLIRDIFCIKSQLSVVKTFKDK